MVKVAACITSIIILTLICRDMAKPSNYKNQLFKNTDFVVLYYRSTRGQLNQVFFSFAMNHLT